MADVLKTFVKKTFEELLYNTYSFLRQPPGVYARIIKAVLKDNVYHCVIQILDAEKQPDAAYPEIPNVRTLFTVKKSDLVVVLLLYGEKPYIVGRI